MEKHTKNGCREEDISSTISHTLLFFKIQWLFLSMITTLVLLPTLFSCEKQTDNQEDRNMMRKCGITLSYPAVSWKTGCLDVFAFDNSILNHLDAYQHYESFNGTEIGMRSQNGEKHIFICANGQRTRQDWASVNSLASLDGIYVELAGEHRNELCMTGYGHINAGSGEPCTISMKTIASEVVLRSIRCDFTGKKYEDRKITDVMVYLTNVNSRCCITADGDIVPGGIMNAGFLDPDDMELLSEPDMLMQDMREAIDERTSYVNMSFICYPNAGHEESPGTPFTRLVIEGCIDGERYWWPIDINRNGDNPEQGIYRSRQYIFDITLRRKGSTDPDTVIETEAADIQTYIQPWKEKEEDRISF